MSDDSHYIAHMLLGDNNTNQALQNAVESGARGAVKGIIDTFIRKRLPALSGLTVVADIIVDLVFGYFNW